MKILEPTEQYIKFIENSAHYLNCPKHMFNEALDSVYRQGMGFNNTEKAIEYVSTLLEYYKYPKHRQVAEQFVAERGGITIQEFNKLNPNSYIEVLPERMQKRHEYLNQWFEAHTTYPYRFSSVKVTESYPFRKR